MVLPPMILTIWIPPKQGKQQSRTDERKKEETWQDKVELDFFLTRTFTWATILCRTTPTHGAWRKKA